MRFQAVPGPDRFTIRDAEDKSRLFADYDEGVAERLAAHLNRLPHEANAYELDRADLLADAEKYERLHAAMVEANAVLTDGSIDPAAKVARLLSLRFCDWMAAHWAERGEPFYRPLDVEDAARDVRRLRAKAGAAGSPQPAMPVQLELANKRAAEAMKFAFPVGAYVEVPRGKGFVRGHVEGHGSWWSEPLILRVRSLRNGRIVRVSAFPLLPEVPDAD